MINTIKGNIYRSIFSIIWIFKNYMNLKKIISKDFNYKIIKLFRIQDWHFGQRYFYVSNEVDTYFMKSLGHGENNLNEIKVLNLFNNKYIYFPLFINCFSYKSEKMVVMEKLNLERLDEFLKKNYLNLEETKKIISSFIEICDIFSKEKIVHRDIRPQNIFINRTEVITIKVIDFAYAISLNKGFLNEVKISEVKKGFFKNLGGEYRYDHLQWDDAYSFLKISENIYSGKELFLLEEYQQLKKKIGKTKYILEEKIE